MEYIIPLGKAVIPAIVPNKSNVPAESAPSDSEGEFSIEDFVVTAPEMEHGELQPVAIAPNWTGVVAAKLHISSENTPSTIEEADAVTLAAQESENLPETARTAAGSEHRQHHFVQEGHARHHPSHAIEGSNDNMAQENRPVASPTEAAPPKARSSTDVVDILASRPQPVTQPDSDQADNLDTGRARTEVPAGKADLLNQSGVQSIGDAGSQSDSAPASSNFSVPFAQRHSHWETPVDQAASLQSVERGEVKSGPIGGSELATGFNAGTLDAKNKLNAHDIPKVEQPYTTPDHVEPRKIAQQPSILQEAGAAITGSAPSQQTRPHKPDDGQTMILSDPEIRHQQVGLPEDQRRLPVVDRPSVPQNLYSGAVIPPESKLQGTTMLSEAGSMLVSAKEEHSEPGFSSALNLPVTETSRSILSVPSGETRFEQYRHISAQLIEIASKHADKPVEITLSPEELGKVRMSFSNSDDGLAVTLIAERPETLSLLRRHADLLMQELREIGYSDVSFGFGQDRDQNGKTDNSQSQHSLKTGGALADAIEPPKQAIQLSLGHSEGIDIRL